MINENENEKEESSNNQINSSNSQNSNIDQNSGDEKFPKFVSFIYLSTLFEKLSFGGIRYMICLKFNCLLC